MQFTCMYDNLWIRDLLLNSDVQEFVAMLSRSLRQQVGTTGS